MMSKGGAHLHKSRNLSKWCLLAPEKKSQKPAPVDGKTENAQQRNRRHTASVRGALRMLGAKAPAKIQEVTLMRPIHGNL